MEAQQAGAKRSAVIYGLAAVALLAATPFVKPNPAKALPATAAVVAFGISARRRGQYDNLLKVQNELRLSHDSALHCPYKYEIATPATKPSVS